jgi:hypothetical protein
VFKIDPFRVVALSFAAAGTQVLYLYVIEKRDYDSLNVQYWKKLDEISPEEKDPKRQAMYLILRHLHLEEK